MVPRRKGVKTARLKSQGWALRVQFDLFSWGLVHFMLPSVRVTAWYTTIFLHWKVLQHLQSLLAALNLYLCSNLIFFSPLVFHVQRAKSNFYLITPSITVDGAKQFTAAALMAKTSFHKAFNALVTIISNKREKTITFLAFFFSWELYFSFNKQLLSYSCRQSDKFQLQL